MIGKTVFRYVSSNGGGGARIHCYQLNRALEKKGISTVTVIPSPRFDDPFTRSNLVEFEYINADGMWSILGAILGRALGACYLHSHLRRADIFISVFSIFLRKKHVVTLHYPYSRAESSLLGFVMHKFALRRADKVVFISGFLKGHILKEYSLNEQDFKDSKIIYNASDSLSEIVVPSDDFDILKVCMVGELSDRKGLPDFIKLVKAVRETDLNVEFHVFGVGPYSEMVNALSKECPNIIVYHGYVADHSKIYSDMHCLLSMSYNEAFGRTVTEAMSCGVVPLLRNSGAFPELVENGRSGFLFDDVASAIDCLKAVSDDVFWSSVSNNAKEKYNELFSLSAFESSYSNFLKSVL